jgi:LmbE family N-acetylglucosaminyl deacetylase
MNILAFGAHPDDIEIYMYGLLMTYLDRGDSIYPVVVTDGSLGTVLIKKNLRKIRQEESIQSLSIFNPPIFLNAKDGSLSVDNKVVNKIKRTISNLKPDLIITHSPLDYHPDHRSLSKYVKEATGFISPIIYADTLMGVNFNPTIYIDISNHIEKKLGAIMCHKSQNPEKFVNATKLLNNFRAAQCNGYVNGYAEAYFFEKYFPFSDIKDLLPPAPVTNKYYDNSKNSFL